MKRLISILLAFLLTLQLVPIALAAEPVRQVSTLDELITAIDEAADGDTIEIVQTIIVTKNAVIGNGQKTITIRGATTLGTFFYFGAGLSTYTAEMINIIVDGSGSADGSKVIMEYPVTVKFDTVTWEDCRNYVDRGEGGALNVLLGRAELINCVFNNCQAIRGGGVYTSLEVSCKFTNCTFTQNSASSLGGAICATGTSEITGCTFSGNSSKYSGGAIGGIDMQVVNCEFIGNRAQSAGAITTFSGNVKIQGCTFLNNFAEQNGGAVVNEGLSAILSENTIRNNHADGAGGGLYLQSNTILENNKIYGNTANTCGADITYFRSLTLHVDDYANLYQSELAEGKYDSLAWFFDEEVQRYTSEHPTNMFFPGTTGNSDNFDPPKSISLIFVMWRSKQENTPIDKPSPIFPTPPNGNQPNHPNTTPPEQKPGNTLILSCGKAIISISSLTDYISTLDTFPLKRNEITRAEMASIIYGLLNDESRRDLVGRSKFTYRNLVDSPYRNEINALTYVGVFSGNSNGNFNPDSSLTFGHFLTILTRFVADIELEEDADGLTSLASSTHWAKNAAQIAHAYGWIDDIPLDLDAHVTYGSLKSILKNMVSQ